MKRSRFLLVAAAFCAGFGLFRVKYQVVALEKSHKEVIKSIAETKETIHILKAELTHLNDPARLQKLAVLHLDFKALKPSQVISVDELPKQKAEVKVSRDPVEALMDAVNAVAPQSSINSKRVNHAA